MWFDHSTEGTPVESSLISRVKFSKLHLYVLSVSLLDSLYPLPSLPFLSPSLSLSPHPPSPLPFFLPFPSSLFLLPSSLPFFFPPFLPPSFSLLSPSFLPPLLCPSGHETKAMLNNSGPRTKRSKLERTINAEIVSQIVILTILCLTGAIGLSAQLSVVYLFDVLMCCIALRSCNFIAQQMMAQTGSLFSLVLPLPPSPLPPISSPSLPLPSLSSLPLHLPSLSSLPLSPLPLIILLVVNGVWTARNQDRNIPFVSSELSPPALEGFIRFWSFLINYQVCKRLHMYVYTSLQEFTGVDKSLHGY